MKLKTSLFVCFFFIALFLGELLFGQSADSSLANNPPAENATPEEALFNSYEQVFSLLIKDNFFINLKSDEISKKALEDFFAKIEVEKPQAKVYRWVDIPKGRPLSLKTYRGAKAKRISEDAVKRIEQSHNYLKNRDFVAFRDINLDIILRQHFSLSAPLSAFLVGRMLLQKSEQGVVGAFLEALDFFAYIINAHRFTQYSDGAFMLLIPGLFERGYYEMAGKLLKLYLKLQRKIVAINWQEQLSVRPEEENRELSKTEIENIKKRFAVATVILAKLEMEKDSSSEKNKLSQNAAYKKVINYLLLAQKTIVEPKKK